MFSVHGALPEEGISGTNRVPAEIDAHLPVSHERLKAEKNSNKIDQKFGYIVNQHGNIQGNRFSQVVITKM